MLGEHEEYTSNRDRRQGQPVGFGKRVAESDIEHALETEPSLTHFGLGVYLPRRWKLPVNERRERTKKLLAEGRQQLLERAEEVQLCCDWLDLVLQRKTINRKRSSYGYKHEVQRYFGQYVSNGAFIAALIIKGVPYKTHPDNPNVNAALSNKLPERRRPMTYDDHFQLARHLAYTHDDLLRAQSQATKMFGEKSKYVRQLKAQLEALDRIRDGLQAQYCDDVPFGAIPDCAPPFPFKTMRREVPARPEMVESTGGNLKWHKTPRH